MAIVEDFTGAIMRDINPVTVEDGMTILLVAVEVVGIMGIEEGDLRVHQGVAVDIVDSK